MSNLTDEIFEKLKNLTLIEVYDLLKKLETEFGISASAPAFAPVTSAVSDVGTAKVEEEVKTEFDLVLESVPAESKIAILKVVRVITGLGLKEAKDLVESAPKLLKSNVSKVDSESLKKQLEDAGAKISIS